MSQFTASPAAPHEVQPACQLLFGSAAEGARERLLSAEAVSGLFVTRAAGRVCAAGLVQALPGALGVACPPRGDSPEAEEGVTVAACAWLRTRGVKVCQAFAFEDETDRMAALERHGFRYVTQLLFLRRTLVANHSLVSAPVRRLSFTPEASGGSEDFAAVLLATHEQTRDCPELNAPRAPAELLAGFTGAKGAAYLARNGLEPVGVVLLESPGPGAAELTYLGVVPSARGRGFGTELLTFALAEAGATGELNVSVDERNAPARRLYAKHGFAEYERRGVWLATWPG